MPEPLDLSKSHLIKTTTDQMWITDTGLYVIDLTTNKPLQVDGFIHIGNEFYAVQMIQIHEPNMAAQCGHHYGCKICLGCMQKGCWNFCPGCKK